MCVEVWVRPDGPEIESQGQLASFLGVHVGDLQVNTYSTPSARKEDACLCPIAVERMLSAAGYVFEYDHGDPMSIHVTGKST